MDEALACLHTLAQRAAHEHIADVRDERDERYFNVAGVIADERDGGKLACRCVVEQAGEKALEDSEAGAAADDA